MSGKRSHPYRRVRKRVRTRSPIVRAVINAMDTSAARASRTREIPYDHEDGHNLPSVERFSSDAAHCVNYPVLTSADGNRPCDEKRSSNIAVPDRSHRLRTSAEQATKFVSGGE